CLRGGLGPGSGCPVVAGLRQGRAAARGGWLTQSLADRANDRGSDATIRERLRTGTARRACKISPHFRGLTFPSKRCSAGSSTRSYRASPAGSLRSLLPLADDRTAGGFSISLIP